MLEIGIVPSSLLALNNKPDSKNKNIVADCIFWS